MADVKISALPAASTSTGDEDLVLVQATVTKKLKSRQIAKVGYQQIVGDATTARTLALSDIGNWIRMTSSVSNTITVPLNSAVAFEIGTTLNGVQAGIGMTTIAASVGVTINRPNDVLLSLRKQFSPFCLIKVGEDTWDLFGDLEQAP